MLAPSIECPLSGVVNRRMSFGAAVMEEMVKLPVS